MFIRGPEFDSRPLFFALNYCQVHMEKLKLVLLDVDGVIYDFVSFMLSNHFSKYGKKPSDIKNYNMNQVIGISKQEFWKVCDEADGIFCDGEFYSYTTDLIKTCNKYSENISFCSNPGNNPKHWAEKKKMFNKLSKTIDVPIPAPLITQNKEILSLEGVVLIDDFEKNVDKFNQGKGIGVLFPQYWNKNGTELLMKDPVGYVDCTLDDICRVGFKKWKEIKND